MNFIFAILIFINIGFSIEPASKQKKADINTNQITAMTEKLSLARISRTSTDQTRVDVKTALNLIRKGDQDFVEKKISKVQFTQILKLVVETMQHRDGEGAFRLVSDSLVKREKDFEECLGQLTPFGKRLILESFDQDQFIEENGNG